MPLPTFSMSKKEAICGKVIKADIAIFEKHPWTVKKENLLYKCGWSPLEEMSFTYRVSMTLVNGQIVYDHGKINGDIRGEMLTFY